MKNETTQPNDVSAPQQTRKWQCDPANPPGKIQTNRVNDKLRDLNGEHYTSVEKSGILGKTDGYDAERSFAVQRYTICGDNKTRPEVTAAQVKIGEKYGWTVSRDNARDIVNDIEAALPALEAARSVEDKRQTQEQADAEKAERIVESQASQARDAARAKELRDITEAAYGVPGRLVHLSPGEKAIVAVLCYDNSHYQSDYFDTHARLGVPLLVGTTRGNREDEASARRAIERFPMLAALKFDWKTEKYSMGHGNYLTSEPVDVPEALGATRTPYGGSGPIKRGHWEIVFDHHAAKDGLSVFAGYYDAPDPQASAEADAAAEQRQGGGSLGSVKRNLEHDGVEIAFNEKPSEALRSKLRANGFRITRRPPWKWYRKYSAHAWVMACEIAGVKDGVDSQERWGNSAIPGVGVNSPAMMEARAQQSSEPTGDMDTAHEEYSLDRQAEAIGA